VSFEPVASVSWLKRASDVVLGILAVTAFGPLFVLIALAIKLDSSGPVFHRQKRIGQHGEPFSMLKFRSMRYDAENVLSLLGDRNEAVGPMFKIRRDPRITRVGRWLRRTSLDELPQLLNVVRGQMSLVGPRPPLPQEVASYEDWQFGRLRVRPGMTGLWQVRGRSEIPFIEMVRLDLYYARNWSLWLDLKILLRTPPSVVSGRGAY
jgi:exopolysaccharide biosynthesis polyprenyl glycosylphosphotransferase